jgi:hypothetical protein
VKEKEELAVACKTEDIALDRRRRSVLVWVIWGFDPQSSSSSSSSSSRRDVLAEKERQCSRHCVRRRRRRRRATRKGQSSQKCAW